MDYDEDPVRKRLALIERLTAELDGTRALLDKGLLVALEEANERSIGLLDRAELAEQEIERLKAECAAMREALLLYVHEYAGIHDDAGCPEDDTCSCPTVAKIEAALKPGAGSALLERLKAAEQVVEAARDEIAADESECEELIAALQHYDEAIRGRTTTPQTTRRLGGA